MAEHGSLKRTDPEIHQWIERERRRQKEGLEMIASENYVSPAVLEAQGSILTNKYAEGYPGRRYYGGCEFIDECENLALRRLKKLFQTDQRRELWANVQPHSGSQANMAVFFAALKPGDKLMGLDLSHGGHLTHGSPVNFSGFLFKSVFYHLNPKTERLDFDLIEDLARREKPKIIVAGHSAYPRRMDFRPFREIADRVGAKLMADMAHVAGLVAAGLHPSPVPWAHYVTSTTHKTLRGPRGGFILCPGGKEAEKEAKKINSKVFPGIQGGPLEHIIAAKAVAFGEALRPEFREYAAQVIKNAKTLAAALQKEGLRLVSGGTDNHLILADLSDCGLTGKEAEAVLGKAGITVNKNTVPGETRSPFAASGIRLGTPALATRGMKEGEMERIGQWIVKVIRSPSDESLISSVRKEVAALCDGFPLYASPATAPLERFKPIGGC